MKSTIFIALIAVIVLMGAFFFSNRNSTSQNDSNQTIQNVSIIDGKQIVEITAKGGFQPRKSIAQTDIPTIVRFNTKGTFDCSSSVRIPSLNISEILPASGITDIDIGSIQAGTLQGSCGMGMYPFEIEFKS